MFRSLSEEVLIVMFDLKAGVFHKQSRVSILIGFILVCGLGVFGGSSLSHAGAIEALKSFTNTVKEGRTSFTQTVSNRQGKIKQQSEGIFSFSRPGRFRWDYHKPYQQLIVGDGINIWMFDKDLNQVTVRSQKETLGQTPAALLAGAGDISEDFMLREQVATGKGEEGMEWLSAIPRKADTGFEFIRLGFRSEKSGFRLAVMELQDSLGQLSQFRFGDIDTESRLSEGVFRFTPPPGVDLIGKPQR